MIRMPLSLTGQDTLQRRTAALLVQVANRYDARVLIECEQKIVNAKSMLGLLSVGADGVKGNLTLLVDGPDEEKAAKAIADLIENNFQE